MTSHKHPLSHTGTFANRMIHNPSYQALIGSYAIDTLGKVRLIDDLKSHRLAATMRHLTKPDSMVYYLTMEGLVFETNVYSLKSRQLFDLVKELAIGLAIFDWRRFLGTFGDKPESTHEKKTCV